MDFCTWQPGYTLCRLILSSIVQEYGGRDDATWERFISELEALPEDFRVLGINDYLFLDGYRRMRQAKEAGRLRNIHLLLPVLEFRLDKFGGTDDHLSRVNFHVIFSDQIDPDVIQQQFLAGLLRHYQLTPQYAGLRGDWQALPTRHSLEDLGRKIIDSVPPEKRSQFKAPLIEGFNNINNSDMVFIWSRRLSKDYERLAASSEGMVYLAMIHVMTKRLAKQQTRFA